MEDRMLEDRDETILQDIKQGKGLQLMLIANIC